MDNEFVESVKELNYANLDKKQEEKLREIEKQFNEEFGTEFYLMVMKKDTK